MATSLSVIIPTIAGREPWLDRIAVASIEATCLDIETEIIIVRDSASCGLGWREGAEKASGDYVLFDCDDVEWLPGWWQAAIAVCDMGGLPAPVILNADGTVGTCGGTVGALEPDGAITEFARAPFLSAAQLAVVGSLLPTHYFCDNWISHRARQEGIETFVAHGYRCVNHDAQIGKVDVPEKLHRDRLLYDRYCSGEIAP